MQMKTALALTACVGALLIAAPASSAPLGTAGLTAAKENVGQGLVEEARHRHWRRHRHYSHRRHRPRLRFYSGPYYSYYRPYYYPYRYGYYSPYYYRRRPGISIHLHF